MRPRIYADTSVFGGCFDEEFEAASQEMFRSFLTSEAILVLSDLTMSELVGAPARVRAIAEFIPSVSIEFTETTTDAVGLAQSYVRSGAASGRHWADALHVALATMAEADVLASWNLRHMVNPVRIRGYNQVNRNRGLRQLEIKTPLEVLNVGKA